MRPNKTWILIANSKSARIVENVGPGKGLSQIPGKTFQAPVNNEHADQEGRSFNIGSGARHKLEAHHGEDQALREHITVIANSLTDSFVAKEFNQMIICAAPATLGAIRTHLNENVRAIIIAEVAKDLTQVSSKDLPMHFEHVLAV